MNQKELKKIAVKASESITEVKHTKNFSKEPFPHFFIDNFFSDAFLNNIISSFPEVDSSTWDISNDPDIEVKMRSRWESEFDIPENIVDAIRIMNSSYFLKALSDALDIPKLMPDPYFSGGGLNATVSGGLLDVHVDGNYHDASGLNRRVNAILYLTIDFNKPIGNGIITALNMKQANQRSKIIKSAKPNKGFEAANAVISILKNEPKKI